MAANNLVSKLDCQVEKLSSSCQLVLIMAVGTSISKVTPVKSVAGGFKAGGKDGKFSFPHLAF